MKIIIKLYIMLKLILIKKVKLIIYILRDLTKKNCIK